MYCSMIFCTHAQLAPSAPDPGFDPLSRAHVPAIALNINKPELSSTKIKPSQTDVAVSAIVDGWIGWMEISAANKVSPQTILTST